MYLSSYLFLFINITQLLLLNFIFLFETRHWMPYTYLDILSHKLLLPQQQWKQKIIVATMVTLWTHLMIKLSTSFSKLSTIICNTLDNPTDQTVTYYVMLFLTSLIIFQWYIIIQSCYVKWIKPNHFMANINCNLWQV